MKGWHFLSHWGFTTGVALLAAESVIGNKALEVRFDPATSSFAVLDRKLGPTVTFAAQRRQ